MAQDISIRRLLTQGLLPLGEEDSLLQTSGQAGRNPIGLEFLAQQGMAASEGASKLFASAGGDIRRGLSDALQSRGSDVNLLTQEEQLGRELQNLNLETPEGLTRLAEIQRMTGDLEGSLQTLGTLQGMAQQENLREGLLKIARQQDNEMLEEFILAGGDLAKVQEYLFKEQRGAKTSAPPTKTDMKLYGDLLEQYTDEDLEKLGLDTDFKLFGFGGGLDDTDKRIIINNAKEIFTNKPELGKKGALDIALRQYSMSDSTEETPTDSSSQMTGAPIR